MGTDSEAPKTGQELISSIVRRLKVLERKPNNLPDVSAYGNADTLAVRTDDGTLKASEPVDPDDVVTLGYLGGAGLATPAGVVHEYAGSSAPSGYLLCDGTSYLRADYPALFAVIGTTFGAVDGTHFNVPNRKGRVGVGRDATQTEFDTLGETGGAKTHVHTGAAHTHSTPAHSHALNDGWADIRIVSGSSNVWARNKTVPSRTMTESIATASATTITTASVAATPLGGSTDSGGAGTTGAASAADTGSSSSLSPYLVMNYIIKT